MTYCWYKKGTILEVIHAEIDTNGYDLIISYNNINRYIQLKTSEEGSSTSTQKINLSLVNKENPCIVWIVRHYDNDKKDFNFKYLFWGSKVDYPLPDIGKYKTAKHSKANSTGIKNHRQNIKVIPKNDFTEIYGIEELFDLLFTRIICLPELSLPIGYNMYTVPNQVNVFELESITEEHLKNIVLSIKEKKDMKMFCNMNKTDLVGKLFDKNGNIYYEAGRQINQFTLRINYFKKLYKNKINGT